MTYKVPTKSMQLSAIGLKPVQRAASSRSLSTAKRTTSPMKKRSSSSTLSASSPSKTRRVSRASSMKDMASTQGTLSTVHLTNIQDYPMKSRSESQFLSVLKAAIDPSCGLFPNIQVQEGDWLEWASDAGETFDAYVRKSPNRPTKQRKTIYILPIDIPVDQRGRLGCGPDLEMLSEYLECYYTLPVKIMSPQPLLKLGRNISSRDSGYGTQYNAGNILSALKTQVPRDAYCMVAVTMHDIYSSNLNFVFGLASLRERVGVFSFCRQDPLWEEMAYSTGKMPTRDRTTKEEELLFTRACKTVIHECGHMFGLKHCVYYQCLMQGSNSIDETDRRPMNICPVCFRKLQWCVGFDILDRYYKMRDFLDKTNYADMARHTTFLRKHIAYIENTVSVAS
eukprot:GFYU01002014.1.p1 GENE.GFYU01002014.1~~GFYU01002014.1.p1  ORF type:complete len:395 (-),score=73.02 GFYU01002014.1:29-1213(-)